MSNWNNKSAPMIWQSDLKEVMFFDIETTTRYKTFAEYQESDLNLICSAIGVYNILRWEGDDNQVREYWTKNGMNIFGNEWPDYLGDQSIRKGGGHIVVMLSHAGVVHLNEIADKVSSYITTVTV